MGKLKDKLAHVPPGVMGVTTMPPRCDHCNTLIRKRDVSVRHVNLLMHKNCYPAFLATGTVS